MDISETQELGWFEQMVRKQKNFARDEPTNGKQTVLTSFSLECLPYIALRHQIVCSSLRNRVFSPRER